MSHPHTTDWDGRTYDRISTPQQEWAQQLREQFTDDVVAGMENPFELTYIRLNLDATADTP